MCISRLPLRIGLRKISSVAAAFRLEDLYIELRTRVTVHLKPSTESWLLPTTSLKGFLFGSTNSFLPTRMSDSQISPSTSSQHVTALRRRFRCDSNVLNRPSSSRQLLLPQALQFQEPNSHLIPSEISILLRPTHPIYLLLTNFRQGSSTCEDGFQRQQRSFQRELRPECDLLRYEREQPTARLVNTIFHSLDFFKRDDSSKTLPPQHIDRVSTMQYSKDLPFSLLTSPYYPWKTTAKRPACGFISAEHACDGYAL